MGLASLSPFAPQEKGEVWLGIRQTNKEIKKAPQIGFPNFGQRFCLKIPNEVRRVLVPNLDQGDVFVTQKTRFAVSLITLSLGLNMSISHQDYIQTLQT